MKLLFRASSNDPTVLTVHMPQWVCRHRCYRKAAGQRSASERGFRLLRLMERSQPNRRFWDELFTALLKQERFCLLAHFARVLGRIDPRPSRWLLVLRILCSSEVFKQMSLPQSNKRAKFSIYYLICSLSERSFFSYTKRSNLAEGLIAGLF